MSILDQQDSNYIEPQTVSPRPTGIRWGIILGLISVVLGAIFMITGMQDFSGQKSNWIPNLFTYGSMIAVFYYAFTQHRDQELGGFMSLGRAISLGFWIALINGLFAVVFTYVYFTFIQPDLMDTIKQTAIDQTENRGGNVEQAKEGIEMMSWMFKPGSFAIMAFMGSLFLGFILSLIIGLIVRKESKKPF